MTKNKALLACRQALIHEGSVELVEARDGGFEICVRDDIESRTFYVHVSDEHVLLCQLAFCAEEAIFVHRVEALLVNGSLGSCPYCRGKYLTLARFDSHVRLCATLGDKARRTLRRRNVRRKKLAAQRSTSPKLGYGRQLTLARRALAALTRRYERDEATDEQLDEAKKRVERLEKLHKNGGSK